MDFSPEVLRKHARARVDQEVQRTRGIIGAYLRGSLLYDSPFLGGAGDIDLVFIHSGKPDQAREIERLTPDIHFDIAHHNQSLYRETQRLRVHPWLGPTLHDAAPLHDPRHFIDYTQSGVRSNFSTPENVLRRAQEQLECARSFWFQRQIDPPLGTKDEIHAFLTAAQQAANALALLHGPPLPTRRLALDLFPRTEAAGAPHIYATFLHLLGGENITPQDISDWIEPWKAAFREMPPADHPHHPRPEQTSYYLNAMRALLHGERPLSALWTLLRTGTTALSHTHAEGTSGEAWKDIWKSTGLWGERYPAKLSALDDFLDKIDQAITSWAERQGATLP